MRPDLPFNPVKLFACSSTLGNLLRFVSGVDKSFRMLIQSVGDSVFFERRENSPTELIPDVRGFGHTFPEAYTTWDPEVKGSVSHQRIIKYDLGDLSCTLRFGVDGYFKDRTPERTEGGDQLGKNASDAALDTLSSEFATSGVSTRLCSAEGSLAVISGGSLLAQSTLLELKTRSFRKKDQDTLSEELPRLWLTGVKTFVLAYHEAGLFNDIRQIDVSDRVKRWEEDNQVILQKFSSILHQILRIARSNSGTRLEIRHRDPGILEIREATSDIGHTLSTTARTLWTGSENLEVLEHDDSSHGHEASRHYSDDEAPFHYSDAESEKDFTACSAEDCGYCGHCSY